MKQSVFIKMVFGMVLIGVAGCANTPTTDATGGRYQIASDPGEVWLLDKTTGHVYMHTKNTGEGWGDMGTPVPPK